MKNILFTLLALTTSVFSQGVKEAAKSLYYIAMGTEIPLYKHEFLSRSDRTMSTVGMGVKAFLTNEHGIDVCTTLLVHPVLRTVDIAVGYVYSPEVFGGLYFGFSGFARDEIDLWFEKFYRVGARGSIGYQFSANEGKSSFIELGSDNHKNLTVRSGLVF